MKEEFQISSTAFRFDAERHSAYVLGADRVLPVVVEHILCVKAFDIVVSFDNP